MPTESAPTQTDVAALESELVALRERNELLMAVVTHCPAVIFVKDTEGRLVLCNPAYEILVGVGPGELLGKTDHEIFGHKTGEQNRNNDLRICASGEPLEVEEIIPQADGPHTYLSVKFPIFGGGGTELRGLAGIATDITERRKAEDARAELQQKIIDVQRTALSELSTPVMPLADGVIALPLVGTIDNDRADAIMQALLDGISTHGPHTAIIDITGVPAVDSHVASVLFRAANGARLLGTKVIITGIHPDVAQALVALEIDWSSVETLATLRDGVAQALKRNRS